MDIFNENDNKTKPAQPQEQTILTQTFQALIADFPSPYSPPPIPKTQDEALFMLAVGGEDVLADVYDFLHRYRDLLQKGWKGKAPVYLQGFGALSEWLAATMEIMYDHDILNRRLDNRTLLKTERMRDFSKPGKHQIDVEQIANLRSNILEVSTLATKSWCYGNYYALLVQYLEAEISKIPTCEGRTLTDEDEDRAQKKILFSRLKNDGFFDVYFFDVNFEGETTRLFCQEFVDDIRELRVKLGDFHTTINDIIHYLKYLINKRYYPDPEHASLENCWLPDNESNDSPEEQPLADSPAADISNNSPNEQEGVHIPPEKGKPSAPSIPPEHRTLPMTMKDAARGIGGAMTSKKLKKSCDENPGSRHQITGKSYVFDTRFPPFDALKGFDPKKIGNHQIQRRQNAAK